MDLASLIGFLGTLGMIAGAMISAGGLGSYIDVPSLLIVVGGSFFAVMYTAHYPPFWALLELWVKHLNHLLRKWMNLLRELLSLQE